MTKDTCKEQLIYEIHNPKKYITLMELPDFTTIQMQEIEKNKVLLTGTTGEARPEKLKVSIGYKDCFIADAGISYGGSLALEKAKSAAEVVEKRLESRGINFDEIRYDYIGYNSLYGNSISDKIQKSEYSEIRLEDC